MNLANGNFGKDIMKPKGEYQRTDAMLIVPMVAVGAAFEGLFGLLSYNFWVVLPTIASVLCGVILLAHKNDQLRKDYAQYLKNR